MGGSIEKARAALAAKRQAEKAEADRQSHIVDKWLAGTNPIVPRRAKTGAERMRKLRAGAGEIAWEFYEATKKIDWERRRRALRSPRDFIREYCMDEGGIFEYEPFAETDAIIDVMLRAMRSNVPYHLRITRGGGKTTLFVWLGVFAICSGDQDFLVLATAKKDMAKPMVDDIWGLFELSDALAQDFPEHSVAIRAVSGSRQRAASQTFLGKPTLIRRTENVARLGRLGTGCPLLRGSESGCIVLAVGFDGKTRGLRIGKKRPSFILLDDIQDDEMAQNPEQVEKARKKIYKTFMRLGSSVKRPSMLMASTPIEPDDLSESIANDQNWKTETFPLMLRMPSDAAMKLWRQYKRIMDGDTLAKNFAAHNELKFYMEHRAAMDEGAQPFWQECFNHDGTEVSAIQHAMNLFLEDEESFQSEYQMNPKRQDLALDLPRSIVPTRILPGSGRRVIPQGYSFVAAATDINPSYALSTVIMAFKADRTAHVLEHIVSPVTIDGKLPDAEFNALVYNALVAHGRAIAALGVRIHGWGIDASGRQFEAVPAFAKIAARTDGVRLPACGMMGRSHNRFNPYVKSRLSDARNSTVLCGDDVERAGVAAGRPYLGKRWIAWDADVYKEAVQRALLAEPGAPGACTLYADGDHTDFAIQVTNEKLVGKRAHGDGREDYVWKSADPHDLLDCCAMCYAIAAFNGISGGVPVRRMPIKKKPRVVII